VRSLFFSALPRGFAGFDGGEHGHVDGLGNVRYFWRGYLCNAPALSLGSFFFSGCSAGMVGIVFLRRPCL
jgi:hypothetical protein